MHTYKTEDATAYLAAIIESSDDAIISKDLDGIIRSWNIGAECLFGYEADEVIGKSITLLIPPEFQEEENIILSSIRSGNHIRHFETIRQDKWGNRLEVSLTISPIKDREGNITGASKIARDISQHKRLERELLEMNDRKDEFLAILSHELRNPLAAIRGGLDVLHRSNYQESIIRKSHDIMERQTNHIIRLVEELLDVTLINQGKLTIKKESITLQQILHLAMESCHVLNREKKHHIHLDVPNDPIFILGDLNRAAQIVINLVSNAIKYTPPNGEIAIIVGATTEEAFIKVQDSGIGIPPDKLEKAFEMFHRVNADSHFVDGLGVGLGIAKKLAEMHGGKITPSVRDGHRGCVFVISFPRLNPGPEESNPEHSLSMV